MSAATENWVEIIGEIDFVPDLLKVVCQTSGMGFAAISRVAGQQWTACAVADHLRSGLAAGQQLPAEATLCHQVAQLRQEIVIEDITRDPVYADHPVPARYGLSSYLSVPILLGDGTVFGTLCAIGATPVPLLSGPALPMCRLFAQMIGRAIDDRRALRDGRAELGESRRIGRLREQFLAVLGHDLRNPLAALRAGTNILARADLAEEEAQLVVTMQQTVDRMTDLVDNLLDLARGRLSQGIEIVPDASVPLAETLQQALGEILRAHPDRSIEPRISIDRPVAVDPRRMAQMVSNLLGNAVTHGCPDQPIRFEAVTDADNFCLSVSNAGTPIPPEVQQRLFQPFFRQADSAHGGLGLGLYICSQIARGHGGTLGVTSSPAETRFTFTMPLGAGCA
ncbi:MULTISPECIES: GAF domain-containing sensor histidine kinase [unclassified Paracoccus (in: a-proteobacteria)]|uniref:GAF domain-containing sensor histidine kinase n=1 Tax=unclassified Paracoccus (in: a-proteobacteria) TaxID=2688777 RepID=UPI0018A6B5C5|nr:MULTISPECIES: GAF domain-containing sensor histidine kinase [unclassified Paracoccus (in: a-proteobacteria)]UXU74859.1 GAF domain-containing sensor histidine kinase [Paracoccus sp. SMMA_5]UXU80759.1 GAF domain-containing sensor histidine kinase [Paracoccus sp. SMMA_5_TC]